ncbi:hypothetical protein EVAR_47042_1 [Eumeta japonica]|uniref:Uncharacterized protein n=1 Tax=Eumeta variegata TaxID=151549 RepID=A0A4C1XK71_EUMVA|nr:hypothetical protein EVAR_47042_1 [Eumeta japonica]
MVSPPKSERDRHKKVKGTRPFHSSTVSPPKSERDRARERETSSAVIKGLMAFIRSYQCNRRSRVSLPSSNVSIASFHKKASLAFPVSFCSVTSPPCGKCKSYVRILYAQLLGGAAASA